jgi:starch phosphorylase
MYYSQPLTYAQVMRCAIALNGSFFNTQRMLSQYVSNAYYPRTEISSESKPQAVAKTETGLAGIP